MVLAGTIANHCGLDDLASYCERFSPLPMVSISAAVGGMTSILIDGDTALREGIRHLVQDHRYRRIAFLTGPDGNLESQARLRVYRETLTSFDLGHPDALVVTGDFRYESGVEAVAVLLDERRLAFDAIVVANDQMALGVIDALRAHGVRMPRDVAIIGFDDIQEARYTAPPLTTVRQPLWQQGRLAVQVLQQRLRGESVDDDSHVADRARDPSQSAAATRPPRRVYMTSRSRAPAGPARYRDRRSTMPFESVDRGSSRRCARPSPA